MTHHHHDEPVPRLERLSRMREYGVARDEPDPRGWTVVNSEGRSVGEVTDLIVDTERMTAAYLDVELDTRLFDTRDEDRHVLVPLDRAHQVGRRVLVDEVSRSWVNEMHTARAIHQRDFWNRWWDRDEPPR